MDHAQDPTPVNDRIDDPWPVAQYRVRDGKKVNLDKKAGDDDGDLDKTTGRDRTDQLLNSLQTLQELLYAEGRHGLLVVLQAMDTGGKDSTIRNVFGPLNPQGCRVANSKAPTTRELGHDFLWRIHQHAPAKGQIAVFNRSHYEDVLVVRVKQLVPAVQWRARNGHINAFEKMLADEGAMVLKFFLHITKAYQAKRLQRRLDRPEKHWKFESADVAVRVLS